MMTAMDADQLKARLRAMYDDVDDENWRVRMHRAISWLARSEQEDADLDARFIFQWIALNAAYAREMGLDDTERSRARLFIHALVGLDAQQLLHDALFSKFTGPIRTLIGNRYVFEPFWTALREHDSSEQWERRFSRDGRRALAAVLDGDTAEVLVVVFDRLYVLRNQLVHGGATWNSGVNREQLRDGVNILGSLVPRILSVMLNHPDHDHGDVLYPVV